MDDRLTVEPIRSDSRPDNPSPRDFLTLIAHPDASRIGERVALGPHRRWRITLSRTEPLFKPVRDPLARPIDDPRVSRRAIVLTADDSGVTITLDSGRADLVVQGAPVEGGARISWAAIADGATLELGRSVAVLLHTAVGETRSVDTLGLVGESDGVERLRRHVGRVADLNVPVLVLGESGSGKELVARAIHDRSPRRAAAYVPLNMATMLDSLATSELFGHVRGAFSGAVTDNPGAFVRANGGTLFLDEVGDTPAGVQAMLLRALEAGEVQPVGGSRTRPIDVRIVAATDMDFEAAVDQRSFRAPLLHRLSGYVIEVPPLRDRRDDIARLAVAFIREELARVGEPDKIMGPEGLFSAAAMSALVRHSWPGNVRQLRNAIRQVVISGRGEPTLRITPEVFRWSSAARSSGAPSAADAPPPDAGVGPRPPRLEVTDEDLVAALKANGWRRGATARALGIARSTVYARIEACPLIRRAGTIDHAEATEALALAGGDHERASELLQVSSRGFLLRLRELGITV